MAVGDRGMVGATSGTGTAEGSEDAEDDAKTDETAAESGPDDEDDEAGLSKDRNRASMAAIVDKIEVWPA